MFSPFPRRRIPSSAILTLALYVLVWPRHAWAYLDPGTGSYIFQMAVAAVLASMFTMRVYFQKVKDWVRGVRGGKIEDKGDAPPPEPPPAN